MKTRISGVRVGIFDSGIGGLNVLKACLSAVPEATYYYYGDNERAPYGSRSEEEITAFTREGLSLFDSLGVDAAVIACNTASAVCLEEMRAEFPFPVVGMEPAVKLAAGHCRNVLVLATPRTAESGRLQALISRFSDCRITAVGLEGLAGAIEAHFLRGMPLDIADYLPKIACDGVVLGCTHYAYLRPQIAEFYGVPVFDGAEGTALRLKNLLNLGIGNHTEPQAPMSRREGRFCDNFTENNIIFVGNNKNENKQIFVTNICFKYI